MTASTHTGARSRLSKNDRAVLGVLKQANAALGAYDILDSLRPAGMRAPLQVYRALNRLMALGLVHRIESLNAFVACAQGSDAHHTGPHPHLVDHCTAAFAICNDCGHVDEFTDPSIDTGVCAWADRSAFTVDHVTLEIRGLCAGCSSRPGGAKRLRQ